MIGTAAAIFLLGNGRIMGASGIIGGLVDRSGLSNWQERAAFLAALVVVPALMLPLYNVRGEDQHHRQSGAGCRGWSAGRHWHAFGEWLHVGPRGVRDFALLAAGHGIDRVLSAGRRYRDGSVPACSGGDLMLRTILAAVSGGMFGAGLLVFWHDRHNQSARLVGRVRRLGPNAGFRSGRGDPAHGVGLEHNHAPRPCRCWHAVSGAARPEAWP